MTYAELVQKIRDYTEVDSNVLTSTIIDGFIQDAEWRIQREVDMDNSRRYATASAISGQRYLNTPTDTLIIRSVQITDGGSGSNERVFLEYRDTNFISEYNPTGAQGQPKYYGNWDQDTIVLAPTPDDTYTFQINYILKPDQLSSSNTETYVSKYFPNGLLYACLVEAYGFLKGPADMIQFYEQKYTNAVQGFAAEQMGRRRSDEYISGSPRLQKQG
tara:strand:- start:1537 stop:2187 length:651 start_codon:yes stop_codon:yes gene_type:complete